MLVGRSSSEASMRPDLRSRSRSSVVLYSFDGRDVLEILAGEIGVGGRDLHAERLALERRLHALDRRVAGGGVLVEIDERARVGRLGERAVLRREEGAGRSGVGLREVDLLLALVGDRHAVHDDVELARLEPRDHAVPILGDDLALEARALAEVHHQVRLEADDLAARVGQVPGLVGPFHADDDGLPVLGESGRREGKTRREHCAETQRCHEFRCHRPLPCLPAPLHDRGPAPRSQFIHGRVKEM